MNSETLQAFELLKKAADKGGHNDPKARIYSELQDIAALVADEMGLIYSELQDIAALVADEMGLIYSELQDVATLVADEMGRLRQ